MHYALRAFALVFLAVGLLIAGALAVADYQEVAPYNKFAEAYNAYTGLLKNSLDDRKAQRRMLDAWRELGRSQHWQMEPCR